MTRSLTVVVDGLVVFLVVLSGYVGLNGLVFLLDPRGFTFLHAGLLLSLTSLWVVALTYLTGCWWLTGATYGCRLMGLRVVGRQGGRLRWWSAFVRAWFCTVFPIGLLWCAGSRQRRSLQDLFLGTRVVYEWQPRRGGAGAGHSSPRDDAAPQAPDESAGRVTRKD